MTKIRAIIKQPGRAPFTAWVSARPENLQEIVGGYTDINFFFKDLAVIYNMESWHSGLLKGLPYNCEILGMDFYGTIIFVGVDKNREFCNVPGSFRNFKTMFPKLWAGSNGQPERMRADQISLDKTARRTHRKRRAKRGS